MSPLQVLRALFLASLLVGGSWAAWWIIIFVPPWNPKAVLYVTALLVGAVILFACEEILYRRKDPGYDKRMSKLDDEQRKKEGRG